MSEAGDTQDGLTLVPARSALVLVDLQNDFLHPNGAYGRNGQQAAAIAALPGRLAPVAQAMRAAGGWVVRRLLAAPWITEGESWVAREKRIGG